MSNHVNWTKWLKIVKQDYIKYRLFVQIRRFGDFWPKVGKAAPRDTAKIVRIIANQALCDNELCVLLYSLFSSNHVLTFLMLSGWMRGLISLNRARTR